MGSHKGVHRSKRWGNFGNGIFLFRHGKTDLNSGDNENSVDRIRGWVDVPLDQEGLADAQLVAQEASRMGLERLFSSDLTRAMQTAQAISQVTGLEPMPTIDLRPWNLGDFQGQSSKEVHKALRTYVMRSPTQPVPGGESFTDFTDRFLGFMRSLLDQYMQQPGNIGIVTHYRNCKVMEAWLAAGMQGLDYKTFFDDNIKTSAIIAIRPNPDGSWTYEEIQKGVKDAAQ